MLTGRKSLNQVISGSGFPLAAQSMVAVRLRSTTFSWGPMSMIGNPEGSWSSGGEGVNTHRLDHTQVTGTHTGYNHTHTETHTGHNHTQVTTTHTHVTTTHTGYHRTHTPTGSNHTNNTQTG